MNILWQTEHYPDTLRGGGSVVNTHYISCGLRNLGHDVVVLARDSVTVTAKMEPSEEENVIRLQPPTLPPTFWPIWPVLEPLWLRDVLKAPTAAFEAFICHDPGYALAFKSLYSKRPVICRIAGAARMHDAAVEPESVKQLAKQIGYKKAVIRKLLAKQNDWMDSRAWGKCDAVVVQSEFMRRDIMNLYRIEAGKIKVVPSGVDHERYGGTRSRAKTFKQISNSNGSKCRIMFCGRLVRMKNTRYLIEGFARMKFRGNCELLIVGDGEERSQLEALTRSLGILDSVRFLGQIDSVEEAFAVADIFVLPSVYEPFSNALIEAMASGLPCIALKPDFHKVKTSCAEVIVDGENGFLVNPGNPGDLAVKLDSLSGNLELRTKLGEAARTRSRKLYDWKTCAMQYAAAILEAQPEVNGLAKRGESDE